MEGFDKPTTYIQKAKNGRERLRTATSAPAPVFGRGYPSRITKISNKKVLNSNFSVERQPYRKTKGPTTDVAALQVSAAETAATSLPSLACGAQDETPLLGPQPEWSPTGFPTYSGNIGTLDMSAQAGFPVDMSAHFPQILDRYQPVCLGDESSNVPSSGSIQSTWDQTGVHYISSQGHTQPAQLGEIFGSTSLSCDYIFPRSSLSDNPSHLYPFFQQSDIGNMGGLSYRGYNNEEAYFALPTMELDPTTDLSNSTSEWVVIDNHGQSHETGDAADQGDSRTPWLIPDNMSNTRNDSSLVDLVGSAQSDASEGDSDNESDSDDPAAKVEDPDEPKRHTRKRLDSEKREQTGNTRKMKACVRCRMQKIRCLPDPGDPSGMACETCSKVSQKSKKVIHRLPCLRWILTETTICRAEGVLLTRRFSGTEMKNLGADDWASDNIRTIQIRLGGFSKPVPFRVRKFNPIEGDCNQKAWKDNYGNSQITELPPYAFYDINEAATAYNRFIGIHLLPALNEFVENQQHDKHVRKTYSLILDTITLKIRDFPSSTAQRDSTELLRGCSWFWFANRNTLGSATLEGPDLLDMEPDGRDCHPHPNDVYVPRMICAQFNNMGYCTILRRVRKQLLEELWRMMASKSPQHFFTIYLAVFMMLHEISVTTRDRYRWAEENNQEGYSLAGQVEAIQEGANIILSHWHYYKRGFNPLTTDWKKAKGKKTVWADLTEKEIEYLLEICDFYNSDESHNVPLPTTGESFRVPLGFEWDMDHYWTRQMFEEDWQPKRTFRRNCRL